MDNQYIGSIIIATVGILIGLALFTTSAQFIGTSTNLATSVNQSFTMPALNAEKDLAPCGQKNTSAVVIYNVSGDFLVTSGNYTVRQATGDDGYLSARINATGQPFNATAVNVSCSYEPKGYITDGSTRTVAGLIVIVGALLIAIVALPQARDWMKSWI